MSRLTLLGPQFSRVHISPMVWYDGFIFSSAAMVITFPDLCADPLLAGLFTFQTARNNCGSAMMIPLALAAFMAQTRSDSAHSTASSKSLIVLMSRL